MAGAGAIRAAEAIAASADRAGASRTPIIALRGVSREFRQQLDLAARLARGLGVNIREEVVHAVDRIDLDVFQGEVVGLVGESGCGKSTVGRMVAGLLPPTSGTILWKGRDRTTLAPREARAAKLAVQMIFQDPYASLNPRLRVEDIIGEAPVVHGIVHASERDAFLDAQLRRVGLDPGFKRRYPHQFSGGQRQRRQRIGIARALILKPEFVVCDEPVSALDVSVQAQVLGLLRDLRAEMGLTLLFVSHDLAVVAHLAHRIAVMYLGAIVEEGPRDAVTKRPAHPYTRALLAAVPRLDQPGAARKRHVGGELPSPLAPPPGCPFHPRCPEAGPRCAREVPRSAPLEAGHRAACHLLDGGVA